MNTPNINHFFDYGNKLKQERNAKIKLSVNNFINGDYSYLKFSFGKLESSDVLLLEPLLPIVPIKSIKITHLMIEPDDIEKIICAVAKNNHLTYFKIANTNMTPKSLEALINMISRNQLTCIKIIHSHMHQDVKSKIVKAISECNCFQKIVLETLNIVKDDLIYLVKAINSNTMLQRLDIICSKFEEFIIDIGNALALNQSITSLTFRSIYVTCDLVQQFLDILKDNETLTSIHIDYGYDIGLRDDIKNNIDRVLSHIVERNQLLQNQRRFKCTKAIYNY